MQAERTETFIITDLPSFKANSFSRGVTLYYAGICREFQRNRGIPGVDPCTTRGPELSSDLRQQRQAEHCLRQ